MLESGVLCAEGWTQIPGREMPQGSGELAGSRVLTVTGSRMEFVINNTEGGWCAGNRLFVASILACDLQDFDSGTATWETTSWQCCALQGHPAGEQRKEELHHRCAWEVPSQERKGGRHGIGPHCSSALSSFTL